jgi:pyruvate/2-oxoglutarate dehydrogenase complex dihydrolipoamide dehydrogenase (E3) component
MTSYYDLVIIGSSWEGIYAASTAAYLKARVALVTHNCQSDLANRELITNITLSQIANFSNKLTNPPFALEFNNFSTIAHGLKESKIWAEGVKENLNLENSLANLAALGVDVVEGEGEFCRLPEQALIVGKRKLTSRAYIIATGSNSVPISIEGSDRVNYLTLTEVLTNQNIVSLPNNLVIVGDSPRTLELTQSLAKLGKNVVLIVEQATILPQEDAEAASLIQAQLEADGVKILTGSPVTQLKQLEDQQWVQVGKKAIAADQVIFAEQKEPNITGLNLPGVGVKYKTNGILVNSKLQTTNPKIYACGNALGGYSLPHLAIYEANIALKNALFFAWNKVNYQWVFSTIFTEPQLARVGITETEAYKRYGQDLYVIRQNFKQVIKAQILEEKTGFLKLIVSKKGEILGAHIVAKEASELSGAIALAMKHKIKLNQNTVQGLLDVQFPYVAPGCAEIMQQTSREFYRQKLQNNSQLQKLLEIWFNWRRK